MRKIILEIENDEILFTLLAVVNSSHGKAVKEYDIKNHEKVKEFNNDFKGLAKIETEIWGQ